MCDTEKDWHERSFRASGEINACQKLDQPFINPFPRGGGHSARLALFVYLNHPTKNDVTSGRKER